jgi:Putative Actinobacterial Holin-X, holin superfamily III
MQLRAGIRERSITDVVIDIGRNVQEILRAEIRLAEREVRERAHSAGWLLAVGVIGSQLSAFFVLFAIHYGLRLLMPSWAAALCVAFGTAVIAFVAFRVGIGRMTARSAQQIKEDLEWERPGTR